MGGSSSQPRTDRVHSPINAFSLEDLYTPEFSDSFQEYTGYWQAPNPYEVPTEQVATSLMKKKKATLNETAITVVIYCNKSEIERLKALLHSNPYSSPSSLIRLKVTISGSLKKHGDERDNLHAFTTPMVTSRVLEEEIASPVELAKAYMSSRPSKAALRQDLVLHNNATGFLKSPNTLIAPKIENGFTTPRSRGRSAMYCMARTPYAKSPSTYTQKGITSSYGREEALTSSQSAFQHGGKMVFLGHATVSTKSTQTATKILQHHEKMDL
ncbi:hypothetical protein Tco_0898168 [Tanacetum coccineum]